MNCKVTIEFKGEKYLAVERNDVPGCLVCDLFDEERLMCDKPNRPQACGEPLCLLLHCTFKKLFSRPAGAGCTKQLRKE